MRSSVQTESKSSVSARLVRSSSSLTVTLSLKFGRYRASFMGASSVRLRPEAGLIGGQPASSPFVDDDVEANELRIRLELRGRLEQGHDEKLLAPRTVQKRIRCIVRIADEIQLRDEAILPTGDLEMDVRRPHHVGSGRVSDRLDRLEPIAALRVGLQGRSPVEVRIQRRRVGVAWMRVPSVRVGLPDLDSRIADRLARKIQHSPHDVEDLTLGTPGAAGEAREIRRGWERCERIERTEDLSRCPVESRLRGRYA